MLCRCERRDYLDTELSGTHTVYLLNPQRVIAIGSDSSSSAAGASSRVLSYWYSPPAATRGGEGAGGCGTTMWSGKERYVWIDLTAGPITFGPQVQRMEGDKSKYARRARVGGVEKPA
jgi:hypothetical protein